MKHLNICFHLLCISALLFDPVSAQVKPSQLTALPGSGVDKANDLLLVWDNSASITKKMTVADFVNIPSMFASIPDGSFAIADVSTLQAELDDRVIQADFDSAIGLKVNTADLSTTGGANKVLKLDGNGTLRLGPVNSTDNQPTQSFRVPAFQRTYYESKLGTLAAETYLIANHSATIGSDIGFGAGVFPELFQGAPRHCFYWDEGFQIGNADNNRNFGRYLYFRALGNATLADPVRQSVPTFWNGQNYNGGSTVTSNMGLQWVPGTTSTSGEFVFAITPSFSAGGTVNVLTNGVLTSVAGAVLPFSVTQAGPKVGVGKVLTFGDGSTMTTAPTAYQARVGNATLVAGTVDVEDISITEFTVITLTRKTAGGTIGDLTYVKDPEVGFTINSSSATDTSRISYELNEGTVADNAPVVSGTNAVGDTLTVSSGGGSGTYQWYSNGSIVSGQTASTYVVRHQDIGLPVTCREDGVVSNAITVWHPDDETGYYADFRADLGTLTTGGGAATNGQPVETWRDQSGNSRHLAALATTNAPLLNTSGTGGRPTYLDFDGANDYLHKVSTITRPQTVFIVAEAKSETANERYFSTGDSGTRMVVDLGSTAEDVKNNGASTTGDQKPLNQRNIITTRTTATLNGIRIDAGTEVTATETTGNGLGMFVGGTSAAAGADQRHYALLVYQADLDSSAQARVRAYLKAKWGTP